MCLKNLIMNHLSVHQRLDIAEISVIKCQYACLQVSILKHNFVRAQALQDSGRCTDCPIGNGSKAVCLL